MLYVVELIGFKVYIHLYAGSSLYSIFAAEALDRFSLLNRG